MCHAKETPTWNVTLLFKFHTVLLRVSAIPSMLIWQLAEQQFQYRKTSNIRRTLAGNKIVDHSDVVGASPVGAAPTTSSFSTWHLASRDSAKTVARQYANLLSASYIRDLTVVIRPLQWTVISTSCRRRGFLSAVRAMLWYLHRYFRSCFIYTRAPPSVSNTIPNDMGKLIPWTCKNG